MERQYNIAFVCGDQHVSWLKFCGIDEFDDIRWNPGFAFGLDLQVPYRVSLPGLAWTWFMARGETWECRSYFLWLNVFNFTQMGLMDCQSQFVNVIIDSNSKQRSFCSSYCKSLVELNNISNFHCLLLKLVQQTRHLLQLPRSGLFAQEGFLLLTLLQRQPILGRTRKSSPHLLSVC